MPLGTEVGLGSGDTVLDGDPVPPSKRARFVNAVSVIFLLPVSAYASFIAFCNLLHQISRLSTATEAFDVKRRSLALFLVLPKPEVVLTVKRWQIGPYNCIKVE